MSVQFYTGGSGSGKSYEMILEVARAAAADNDERFIVLVPNQFTLSTQKMLVEANEHRGIMNIEVLSFERLAYRVFDELGIDVSDVLEDTGKSLLLRRVCDEKKDELGVLGQGIDKVGFIDELKSLLTEFGQYDIAGADLFEFEKIEGMGDSFYERIADIRILYEAFEEAIEGRYITAEAILSLLCEHIEESGFVRGANLVFDGYTGFTPVQNRLMERMLPIARSVKVAITIDPGEPLFAKDETSMFAMSRQFAGSLRRIADNAGVELLSPRVFATREESRFIKDGMLSHLEANIFRKKYRIYEGDRSDEIEANAFSDAKSELEFAAYSIVKALKENESLRFKDFAVLCPDINEYKYLAKGIFSRFGIPVFIDDKEEIVMSPFIDFVKSIVELHRLDFSYEAVMKVLKCRFLPIEADDIDALDNYLLATGIRGRASYERIFDRSSGEAEGMDLVRLNKVREMIRDSFCQDFILPKKGEAKELTKRLYLCIRGIGCEKLLRQRAREKEKDDPEGGMRLRQLYPKVMDLFDKMVRLLGDTVMTIEEFEKTLNAGLSSLGVGIIPPSFDSVTFGDMERSRTNEIHTLFLVGMSDAFVPKRFDGGGLLLQSERLKLAQADIVLAPDDRTRAYRQKFYIYLALTRPKRRLVISYSSTNSEGEGCGASFVFPSLKRIFPGLGVKEHTARGLRYTSLSKGLLAERLSDAAREFTSGGMEEDEGSDFFLHLAYLKEHDRPSYDKIIKAAGFRHEENAIQRAVAKLFYNDVLYVSASKLERYAACAYSYFLAFVLDLQERSKRQLAASDLGNLYHEVLERYARGLEEKGLSWFDVTEEEQDEILEESIAETYRVLSDTRVLDSAREKYILERMRNTLRRTIWALTLQVRAGSFVPKKFEVSLSELGEERKLYELSDGTKMKLAGYIDRIDTYENDSDIYVKVIDYKSGPRDVDLNDAYSGIQIQLILYMKAAIEAIRGDEPDRNVIPAALLYYHIDDPIVEADGDKDDGRISELLIRELKTKGLLSDSKTAIEALDENIELARKDGNNYSSFVIPVDIKKDGSFKRSGRLIDEEGLDIVGRFVEKRACDAGDMIVHGAFDARPYRKSDRSTGCDYCPYHSVCGFDTALEGFSHRIIGDKEDADVIIGKMSEELEEDGIH